MRNKKAADNALLTCLIAAAVGGVLASTTVRASEGDAARLAQNSGGATVGGMTPGTAGNTGTVDGAGADTTNNTLGGPAIGPGSATPQTQGFGGTSEDAAITTKLKSAFVQDKGISAQGIRARIFKGVVQLSGFASSAQEADHAAEVARQIPGVKEVQNNIEIEAAPQPLPKSPH